MDEEIKETLGKIKGAPAPIAICMKPDEIKGKRPHVKLGDDRSTGNAFSKGKIS